MAMTLDHLILPVNDRESSIRFYTEVLGFEDAGEREPFSVIRVSPDLLVQLAPWGTPGNFHLAFSMTPEELDAAFDRIRDAGIAYGDAFDAADNMKGPGTAEGAHGTTRSLYCLDSNRHLIELVCYPGAG